MTYMLMLRYSETPCLLFCVCPTCHMTINQSHVNNNNNNNAFKPYRFPDREQVNVISRNSLTYLFCWAFKPSKIFAEVLPLLRVLQRLLRFPDSIWGRIFGFETLIVLRDGPPSIQESQITVCLLSSLSVVFNMRGYRPPISDHG